MVLYSIVTIERNEMLFLGDIHGAYELIPRFRGPITQVGDFGIGFEKVPELRDDFRFIRGNHDDPFLCQSHPNFIGDWKLEGNVLYLSGAFSIDKSSRIPFISWWPDEELNVSQMNEVLSLDPDSINYIVAHDCPAICYPDTGIDGPINQMTPLFLNEVANRFRPHKWVCGHHHKSRRFTRGGTQYTVLGVGEVREVEFESIEY